MTLNSCSVLYTNVTDRARDIQPNMTMDDVRNMMGKPHYRSFGQNEERWEYRTRVLDVNYDVVSIVFNDGRVKSMESFREVHPKFPEPQPVKSKE